MNEPTLNQAIPDLLEKVATLLEWMPICSEGSSGHIRRVAVEEAMHTLAEAMNESLLHWRKTTISFDKGKIVIEYAMPSGTPDVREYPLAEFYEKSLTIAKGIAFHVTP